MADECEHSWNYEGECENFCGKDLLDHVTDQGETIARLERERDLALQERQRFENMYSDQVDSASQFANELDDANKLLDEARGVRDHYIQQYARAVDLLKEADAARQDAQEFDKARRFWQAEASRTGANAARMRLMLEEIEDAALGAGSGLGESPDARLVAIAQGARRALTPDDGWLARKIEEAVEPYRTAERELSAAYVRLRMMIPGALDTPHGPTGEQVWETTESALRALLGGTPTREGE